MRAESVSGAIGILQKMILVLADEQLHLIPVVLITAFPDKAKPMLARALVKKPINLTPLLGVVGKCCAQK